VPTFADRGCDVVSVTDPYGRILGFLDRLFNISLIKKITDMLVERKEINGTGAQKRQNTRKANNPIFRGLPSFLPSFPYIHYIEIITLSPWP
jgi:hypothetical protein